MSLFFPGIFKEDATGVDSFAAANDPVDAVMPVDAESIAGIERIADDVEDVMQAQALENADYFEGGEEAVHEFMMSPRVKSMLEAFPTTGGTKFKSIVTLNRKDDLKRRARLASIIVAREKKDPLFDKLAKNRVKERMLRRLIFQKYGRIAFKIARVSQKKHAIEVKKEPAMPFFKKDSNAKVQTFGAVMNTPVK